MYELILRSKDQMVHVAFYDWLIYKDMSESLLEVCFVLFCFHHLNCISSTKWTLNAVMYVCRNCLLEQRRAVDNH